jgi:formate dehydrogenase subunit beta
VPEAAAIYLHLFGREKDDGIPVSLEDQIAQHLDLPPTNAEREGWFAANQAASERLRTERNKKREVELLAIQAAMTSNGGLAGLFETCIRCHNCMTACPICYCKVCLFKSESFRHEPEYFIKAARRKGVLRMLPDTMLFHLTRMSHMSLSCVGCGMCSSACPVDIPVGTIFQAVGSQVQKEFNYQPGHHVDEALPLISYQPAEWTEVGEER